MLNPNIFFKFDIWELNAFLPSWVSFDHCIDQHWIYLVDMVMRQNSLMHYSSTYMIRVSPMFINFFLKQTTNEDHISPFRHLQWKYTASLQRMCKKNIARSKTDPEIDSIDQIWRSHGTTPIKANFGLTFFWFSYVLSQLGPRLWYRAAGAIGVTAGIS